MSSFLIIDCQTNGSRAKEDQIIQIAWKWIRPNQEPVFEVFNVKLKASQILPARNARMTGLSEQDLKEGISLRELKKRLESIIHESSEPLNWVAHYLQFERAFLLQLLGANYKKSLPGNEICTHRLSKLHFPDLPSFSLEAVSGYLGRSLGKIKGAEENVLSTELIWSKVSSGKPVKTSQVQKPNKKNYLQIIDSKTRLSWPTEPGIYRMYGKDDSLLYVGKAKNLKSRLNSYFRGQKSKGQKLNVMLSQVDRIDPEPLRSEHEAILKECIAIGVEKPRYNVALQSDSSRPVGFDFNLEFFEAHLNRGYWTSPGNSLEILLAIESHVFEDTHLNDWGTKNQILKTMSELNRALGFSKLPKNPHERILTLLKRYWYYIQVYEVPKKESSTEELVEALHNLFVQSALVWQRGKWLKRLAESKTTWSLGSDTFSFEFSMSQNEVNFLVNNDLESFRIMEGDHINRLAYNTLTTYLSLLKRSARSGDAVTLKISNQKCILNELSISRFLVNMN